MIILQESDLARLTDYAKLFEKMRQGIAMTLSREIVVKPRLVLSEDPWWGVMAAYHPKMGVSVKTVAVTPRSIGGGNSVTSQVVLFDHGSGKPLCLLEGGYFTAVRTAVTTCVALSLLPSFNHVYCIGAGVQAQAHALALTRTFGKVKVNSSSRSTRSAEQFERFCRSNQVVFDPTMRLDDADVILCATSSREPVLQKFPAQATSVCSIGAHTPDARELSDRVLKECELVLVDDVEACRAEAGDIVQGLLNGSLKNEQVTGLNMALHLSSTGKFINKGKVIYKSVGSAYQDLVAARYYYEEAEKASVGSNIL